MSRGGRFETDRLYRYKNFIGYFAGELAFISQLYLRLRLCRFYASLVFIHRVVCTIKHVRKL